MKPGAESDPFEDDDVADAGDAPTASVEDIADATETDVDVVEDALAEESEGARYIDESGSKSTATSSQEPPYVLRRNTVKEDRDMVQFFLREQFIDGERDLRRDVEGILDTGVKKTDLREAAYAFAQEHPEAVAEILLEWGYEYR